MIHRQPPPVVNASLADAVTPDKAKVLISLSKQRAYLMADDQVYIDTPISSGKNAGMTPTGVLLGIATVVLVAIAIQLSISVSGLQSQVRDLAESNALLEARLVDDAERPPGA